MYHYERKVQIFLDGPEGRRWKALLETLSPPEGFSYRFETGGELTPARAAAGDVLILPPSVPPETLRAVRTWSGGETALLRTPAQMEALDEETLALADAVWEVPMSDALIKFRFSQLQAARKTEKDLWLAQNYLDTLLDSASEMIWFKDLSGAHLKVNDSFCRVVNKTKEQIRGRQHAYIWGLSEEERLSGEFACRESDEEVVRRGITCQFDEQVRTQGGVRQLRTCKSPIFDETHQKVLGTVGMAYDVTNLQNMTSELEFVLKSVPFALAVCDGTWKILSVNPPFERYFQKGGEALVGRDYPAWKREALRDERPSEKPGRREAFFRREESSSCFELLERPILDIFGDVAGYLCLYIDVTLERKYQREMQRYANCDPLTGLYNRRYFFEFMRKNRGCSPVSLLYIDVDNFKQINDFCGHQHGDWTLSAVALEIKNAFPEGLAVRMGGDEFMVALLGRIDHAALESGAETLLERIKMQGSAGAPSISMSIGIAYTDDPGVSVEQLTYRSDAAMYHAKRSGKAQYCFYAPQMENERDSVYPQTPREDGGPKV